MSAPHTIRIVLVDDHRTTHEIVSKILRAVPDIKLVGQGSNGEEALMLCEETKPDMILMDVVMPGLDGIEATRQIHEKHPDIKVLVLSSFQDDDSVRLMLNSGAVGYVLKTSLRQDLVDTVRACYGGNSVFSPEITQTLLRTPGSGKNFNLSDREREILKLIARGMSNSEIAEALFISGSTVKFHLTNILSKMQVDTRAEAIVLAAKNDLV